jgi:hypothetical protein
MVPDGGGMAMSEVQVRVFHGGQQVDQVSRPLRQLDDGRPAVTYRKRLHPLVDGAIYLDGVQVRFLNEAPSPPYMEPSQPDPNSGPRWDQHQRAVVEAPPQERLLVDAGPGTGKTEVAIGRIAHLIAKQEVSASRVWLISFTRTAVAEVRARVLQLLGEESDACSIRIATLDSHAWALHSGFDAAATITGSHEQNIEKTLDLVRSDGQLHDELQAVEHLVVDEAQDIVGVRADLVIAIIEKLPRTCGVTVFADEAQAIYGFADDSDWTRLATRPGTLPQRLRRMAFESRQLVQVYRTTSPGLLELFQGTRSKLLNDHGLASPVGLVRDDIGRYADGDVPQVDHQALVGLDNAFVLYRKRAEVLLASSFLVAKGVPHRVRMSGLPTCVHSWVGVCLWDHVGGLLTRTAFLGAWDNRVEGTHHANIDRDVAWERLVEVAGRTRTTVDVHRLRSVLGRAAPPAPFCHAEVGSGGPVIGTIHAAKGREADIVHLMLPGKIDDPEQVDVDEEARVLFVGATRARRELKTGNGFVRHFAKRLSSGRAYQVKRDGRVQIEIGRAGDITAGSVAATALFDRSEVAEVQGFLTNAREFPLKVSARSGPAPTYAYRLLQSDAVLLGGLAEPVNWDLFDAGAEVQRQRGGGSRRPPAWLNHINVLGVQTIVLPPESPDAELLHEPWRTSGILLAPIVLGYTTVALPFQHGGR